MKKNRLVVSSGDPAGCGPLISLLASAQLIKKQKVEITLVGDACIFNSFPLFARLKSKIRFIDLKTPRIGSLSLGKASRASGAASLGYLKEALKIIKKEGIKALVTAPVSKEAIQLTLPSFVGHTEYLARYFKAKHVVMVMAQGDFRVALFTRHVPLNKMCPQIRSSLYRASMKILSTFLKRSCKIGEPKIALCSVNPHAGLGTYLGKEEKVMVAAQKSLKIKVYGPYPADTLFMDEQRKHFDCIVCAYHDQAMIPFKLLAFKQGVNVTVGLPIVRTSPDHGVAYNLIRSGKKPFHSSMVEAMRLALKLSS